MSIVLLVAIGIVIALAIWYSLSHQETSSEKPAWQVSQSLTPQEYQVAYATRDHLLIDVRTPEEFASGHIPGAVNIALPTLPQQMVTLPKEQPIVLYCRSGARSREAAKILSQGGFNDVYNLGGIIEWQAQGLPLS